MTRTLSLRKHHGLGNDFLVLLDVDASVALDLARGAELARNACDRHRGIGADGLLIVTAPEHGRSDHADVAMRLHNADGSLAEMSGNGIRCLAQAVVDAGLVAHGTLRVATDAGLRVLGTQPSDGDGKTMVSVDMGVAVVGAIALPESLDEGGYAAMLTVDIGNPHLVVAVDDVQAIDMASVGPSFEKHFLDAPTKGINVEVAAPGGAGGVAMRVWERGVGVTEACGTGACAVAIAAQHWGWIDDRARVAQPGGEADVVLHRDNEHGNRTRVELIGPSQYIATIEFPLRG